MKIMESAFQKWPKHKIIKLLLIVVCSLLTLYSFLVMPGLKHRSMMQDFNAYNFAHRGLYDNTCLVPENSLLAFQKAVDRGYGIELDVQLTKDKIPVVLHDFNLQRMTGENILVSTLTYKELSQYKLFGTDEGIPTLEETLNLINGQVPVMIELKVGLSYARTCQKVASVLKYYRGDYAVISFSPLVLRWFKENMPDVIRGQLSTNYFKDHMKTTPVLQFMLTHLMLNFVSRPDFISYNYKYASNPSLNICRKLFLCPAAAWTIKNQSQFDEADRHFDMIVFDSFSPPTDKASTLEILTR